MFVDKQSQKGAHIHVLGWKGQCCGEKVCEEGYFSEKSAIRDRETCLAMLK